MTNAFFPARYYQEALYRISTAAVPIVKENDIITLSYLQK